MADDSESQKHGGPEHRGRLQAQGGGTEKSESWAQDTPPTESEMLRLCDALESQLTEREKRDREQPSVQLRRFIRSAAQAGGVSAPVSKSWLKRGSKDIRVDLEVIKGIACVPDLSVGAEMVDYLFANFLNDPREYNQAETMWRERWDDLVRRIGQQWLWQSPWANTSSVDGTPIQDGNPIFSAISDRRRLGVRVIQLEPSDNPRELYVWTDTFAKGSPEAIKELVISCVLTNQTLLDAVDLMKQWITEEEVSFSWENEYLGISPVRQSAPPRRLEMAVA